MDTDHCDVAIVGAGLSGISLARFYLDAHPDCRLIIIEKASFIGGVWCQARIFDDFWTQSPLRMTAFADRPMTLPNDASTLYDTFQAKYVTDYLEKYVNDHIYQGKSLRDRIWLGHEVISVSRTTAKDRWILQVKGQNKHSKLVNCSKLAIASGLTSTPNMPSFPIDSNGQALILHHRDFGAQSERILAATSSYKHITVLGGGKSSADMVYAAIKAGKNVNWVIRKTGEGPGIFMNPASNGRYRHAAEKGTTQNATALSPSSLRPMTSWAVALHQNPSQRQTLETKLFAADRHFKDSVGYRNRKNALICFKDLEPTTSFFWQNGPVGAIVHDDFWDLVSQRVHVYRSDPVGTTKDSLALADGRRILTDVLLCGTGWLSGCSFLTPQQACELGLPHEGKHDPPYEAQRWHDLDRAADEQILREYPLLGRPPATFKPKGCLTPARLYRGIAPIHDNSIVFLGLVRFYNSFLGSDAQAIWTTAYWDGHISLPSMDQLQHEISYMNMFSRRRYPTSGVDGLNLHADLLWYVDTLLTDAGLSSHRKGWWEDWDEPCLPADLADCADEYKNKYR